MLKAEDRKSNRIEQEVGANSVEKNQKPQQLHQKQNPEAKDHEVQQGVNINAPKHKRSTAITLQKKLPRDKSVPADGRSIKPNEKVPMKDPADRRHQDAAPKIDNSKTIAADDESPNVEGQSHNSSKTEHGDVQKGSNNPLLADEKPIEVSATQQRRVARKVQRREIPEKIEVLMTRRNANHNRLTRSTKGPASMLKELKQQMQNKNRRSKNTEEPSDGKIKEGKEVMSASEIIPALFALQSGNIASKSIDILDDFQMQEQPSAVKDAEEPNQGVQSIEENTELDLTQHGYMQFPALNRQEQLTEPEKNLKETVIKSQMFLSAAEALFKLNIPVSFLHAGEHEIEVPGRKVVLDSAYEVMKRKARQHEFTQNLYMKTTVSNIKLRSLDDLVRQLCKDLEMLKSYGMNGSDECDVAAGLHKMLNKDIYNEVPDMNCMWDFEWSRITSIFPERKLICQSSRHEY